MRNILFFNLTIIYYIIAYHVIICFSLEVKCKILICEFKFTIKAKLN